MVFHSHAPEWPEAPDPDRVGVAAHVRNAFEARALRSPGRTSILLARYARRHGLPEDTSQTPPDIVFSPRYLPKAEDRAA